MTDLADAPGQPASPDAVTAGEVHKLAAERGIGVLSAKALLIRERMQAQLEAAQTVEDLKPLLRLLIRHYTP